MSDELSNFLMNGSRHAALSAESLELMGKQAANRFLNEKIPLNESICKLAGEHHDINGEQIRRIAEFANNAVYLAKHDQNKNAKVASSYPQFELADASRIIQEMSDGARPTVSTPVDIEYSRMPEKAKTASASDGVIEQMFGFTLDKSAERDYSRDTAISQVTDAKSGLVSLKDNLEHHADRFSMSLKEAQADYYGNVKRHLLEGGSFSDVILAAQSSGAPKHKIAEALRPVIEQLLREKVASPVRLQVMAESLEKVAHRVVNVQHPLVSSLRAVFSLEHELEKMAASLETVDESLEKARSFIKEQLLASPSRKAF